MTLEPAAVIEGFAYGDAIEPGLQRAAPPKLANTLKGLEKNLLRAVRGVRGIAEHAQDEVKHRGVVVGDQPVECGFRAGLQLGDQFGFVAAPREGAGPIGHAVPFSGGGLKAPPCWTQGLANPEPLALVRSTT